MPRSEMTVYMRPELKRRIQDAAARLEMTPTAFVRMAVAKEIDHIDRQTQQDIPSVNPANAEATARA